MYIIKKHRLHKSRKTKPVRILKPRDANSSFKSGTNPFNKAQHPNERLGKQDENTPKSTHSRKSNAAGAKVAGCERHGRPNCFRKNEIVPKFAHKIPFEETKRF